MRVYHSNRLETLAAGLADLLRADPGDPLAPERIVIPHRTMQRWLTLELARAFGVAANLRCELPAGFAWSIMRDAVPELPGNQAWSPDNLRWHIYDILPQFAETAAGAAVRRFLEDGDDRKRFAFADRLAGVCDRCLLYRPDWVRDWQGGATPHWQAELWRQLTARIGRDHWVGALDAFAARLADGERPAAWPRRACFFAVNALSPSYLEAMAMAARGIELHFFLLNPCEEYWGDIHSRHESVRRTDGADPGEQYFAEGNELLAAWGRAGRDTFEALIDVPGAVSEERFAPPGGAHRLATVQRDILALRLAGEAQADQGAPQAGGTADASLQIHACHSPMREAEVLHDRLLDLFDRDAGIEPADVLVLTPDAGRYGPAIAAVFGAAGRIPVTLSAVRTAESPSVRAFFDLLALPRSRYGAEAVLAPLEAPAVQARFGISPEALATIRHTLRDAEIRATVDGDAQDAEAGEAAFQRSWKQGLRRLLMGYAAADGDALVLGVAPCRATRPGGLEAGADDHEALGRFVTFCNAAFDLRSRLGGARGAGAWAEILRAVVATFFDDGDRVMRRGGGFAEAQGVADEVEALRRMVRTFEREACRAQAPLPFAVVREVLADQARSPTRSPARLDHGVTVASLASGQVFPAKAVCVVGMNAGVFPRSAPSYTFDPLEHDAARRGDRDIRDEDRFAFLEALLAARESFIVCYTGRSLRDDAAIPPSIVVDELADYIEERFPGAAAKTRHPLQPFSPRYFTGEANLFSYAQNMCAAADAIAHGSVHTRRPGRFTVPLAPSGEARGTVALAELEAFFANPARAFLRDRCGIDLRDHDVELREDDPFALDGLERYRLRDEIRERLRADDMPQDVETLLRRRGRLPRGSFGQVEYGRGEEQVRVLEAKLARHADALDAEPQRIDVELAGMRVTGVVGGVGSHAMVWWRDGRFRETDRISLWLRQLAWAASGNRRLPAVAVASGEPASVRLKAPFAAAWLLEDWLKAWRAGQEAPLPFFPKSSWAYARALTVGPERGLGKARDAWSGSSFSGARPESGDAHFDLVWSEREPFTRTFETWADRLLTPLVRASSS